MLRTAAIFAWPAFALAQAANPTFDEAFFAQTDLPTLLAACATRARTLEPLDGRLSVEYAECFLAAGDEARWRELLQIATTLRPKDSEVPRLVAHAWFMRGNQAAAVAALAPLRAKSLSDMDGYLRAAEDLLEFIGPAEADAMMEVGYAYDRADVGAFTEFGVRCARSHPALAVKWLVRGFRKGEWERTLAGAKLLLTCGHPQEAGVVLEEVARNQKGSSSDWLDFAKEAGRQGAVEARIKFAAQYRAMEFRKPGSFAKFAAKPSASDRIDLGVLHLLAGDRPAAEAAFAEARTLPGANPQDAYDIAAAWMGVQDREAARQALESAPYGQVMNPSSLATAGGIYLSLGRVQEAEACLNRAMAFDPKAWDLARDFGLAALEAGHPEVAARWLTRPGAPKGAKEHLGLAAIHLLDRGHREAAERVMEAAFRLDPRDWPNCCEFGRAAIRNGHRDLAAVYFARGVQHNPTSGRMWNEIALAFAEGGKGIRNEFHLD
jgi:predicted Zn-dependent protease